MGEDGKGKRLGNGSGRKGEKGEVIGWKGRRGEGNGRAGKGRERVGKGGKGKGRSRVRLLAGALPGSLGQLRLPSLRDGWG